jgi:hypothetical protein
VGADSGGINLKESGIGKNVTNMSATEITLNLLGNNANAAVGVLNPATFEIAVPGLEALGVGAVTGQLGMAARGGVVAGGLILGARALSRAANFEAQHIWTSPEFHELLANPDIPQGIKDGWLNQMYSDPLLGQQPDTNFANTIKVVETKPIVSAATTKATVAPVKASNPVIPVIQNPPVAENKTGVGTHSRVNTLAPSVPVEVPMPMPMAMFEVQGMPWLGETGIARTGMLVGNTVPMLSTIFAEPFAFNYGNMASPFMDIHEPRPLVLITPVPTEEQKNLGKLPGFEPQKIDIPDRGFEPPEIEIEQEGFDIHERDWRDLILFRKLKEIKGWSAEDREEYQKKLKESIKITYGKEFSDEQLDQAAKKLERKLIKYAKGGKIFGNSQETGTEGHKEAIELLKQKYVDQPDVAIIALDLSLLRILGVKSKQRPDLTIVMEDGRIILIEVESKSQFQDVKGANKNQCQTTKLNNIVKELEKDPNYKNTKIKTKVRRPAEVIQKYKK